MLHERHAPWLRAQLSRRCADPDAVDTAIQDTFVAVWRGAARYQAGDGDAGAWLWTIAIRKLISVLRSQGIRWIGDGYGYKVDDTEHDAITASAEDLLLLGVEHGDGRGAGPALARSVVDLPGELARAPAGIAEHRDVDVNAG